MLLVSFGVKQSLLDSMPRKKETVTFARINAALPSICINRDNIFTILSIIVIHVCTEHALIDDGNFKLLLTILNFFDDSILLTATLARPICNASHVLALFGMAHGGHGKKD
jgi:hypothetical protein